MDIPEPYRWSFDRNAWDGSEIAETFSVGVYQWLPAASGKKLKRSKSIRVNGYTADPAAAYAKAQELCDRLNAEGVMAEDPPAWLRKQYSVPRPPGTPPAPAGPDLSGSRVRAIRLRAMERCLVPEGFVKGDGSTYVRRQGDQIHLIDFQANTFGHDYTVNLGFHYTFVLPLFHEEEIGLARYHLLDCALSSRLGYFGSEGKDVWYDYGDDAERLQATLERNARDSLAVFERYAREWRDPEWWLARAAERGTQDSSAPWAERWHLNWPELFLGAIALHLGRAGLARDMLADLLRRAEGEKTRRLGLALLARIDEGGGPGE